MEPADRTSVRSMCDLYSITANQEAIRAVATSCALSYATPGPLATYTSYIVPSSEARACAILAEFNKAQTELIGKAVILTDGKAGTVDEVWLDEFHGLRISIRGHEGKWPVSTIKLAQS